MSAEIEIDRLEFVVLAERAGLNRIPLVAGFSHSPSPVDDIPAGLVAAEERCRQRGLLGRGGRVRDDVWDLLGIYANTAVEYDLRFSSQDGELRVAVSRSGELAVRTLVHGDWIGLAAVHGDQAIPALVGTLPELGPARIRPALSVDLTELRAVMGELEEAGEDDPRAVERGLRKRHVNVTDYRRMTEILDQPRLGLGEIGVTVWGSLRKEYRGDQTIRVVDLESGRAALYNAGNQRMLVGADVATFNRVLGELTTQTQRKTRR